MAYRFTLPQDDKQLANVFEFIVAKGKARRSPQAIRWWIANYYLQGVRNFSNLDYGNGTVQVAFTDERGVLKFQYEDIVSKYQAQLGRLLSLNLSPRVKIKGISLDGLKKASTAQVVLDSAFPEDKVKKLALDLCPTLLNYGTVGLYLWVESAEEMGIEVVNPWEIIPIPVDVASPNDVRGIVRMRYVPVEWIKSLARTPGYNAKAWRNLDKITVPTADVPADITAKYSGQASISTIGSGFYVSDSQQNKEYAGNAVNKKKDEKFMDITMLVEAWTETGDGHLAEYVVLAGMDKLTPLYRKDHSESKYNMPMRILRDITVGSFWGRSFVDLMIPLNTEIEYALASLFQSVTDFDLYGITMWPNTLGTPAAVEVGTDGIKKLRYEVDYTAPEQKPFNVQPAKLTSPQLDVVKTAVALMDKVANMPSAMMSGDAPGRVDSSAGLGFLYEVSSIPIGPTAKNIADAVAGIYRAMLGILKDSWTDQKVVEISSLDENLAGLVLDSQSGSLKLSKNAIPSPDEVQVSILSDAPVSKEQQKTELKEALDKQRITLDEFNFEVRKKGLDIPVGGEIEWQNHRRATLENIVLFGDGVTPGAVTVSERDIHRIHKADLDAFMARPEFYLAGEAVRAAFVKHYEEHLMGLGTLPEGMPTPEEAAEIGMMMAPPEGGQPMMNQ